MTEIIRVAERCARKKQTNLDTNSTQKSLKMSKRLDVLEIFISLKVTRQNLLKKLYLGSKQDAE
jgi:hypothetical protein